MKLIAKVAALSIFSISALFGLEQTDKDSINGAIYAIADSWNQRECHGFADAYTDDADFVNIFGMLFQGKEEIEDRHIKIMQGFLKNSTFEVQKIKLREVQPGLVIAILNWSVQNFRSPFEPNKPPATREGVYSFVFIQKDNKWQITSAHNTLKPLQG